MMVFAFTILFISFFTVGKALAVQPTERPTEFPTIEPTWQPTEAPSAEIVSTAQPTASYTSQPSIQPSFQPTALASITKKRFILRLDAVQDYYLTTYQQSILNYLMNRNIPVSAGVIGGYFTGQDTALYSVLKKCVSLGKDNCMLANNGMNAQYLFANAASVTDATTPVQNADNQMKQLFPGYITEMMQPYQGSYNTNLLTALTNLGFSVVSGTASSSNGPSMTWDLSARPLQMPKQTSTGIVDSSGQQIGQSVATIVSDCDNVIAVGQDCVIALNALEFSTGQFDLTKLGSMIDTLIQTGYTPITFHKVTVEVFGLVDTQIPTMKPTTPPRRRFVLRFDDMQDWYLTHAQQNVLNYLMDRNVAVSAGIIGQFFTGADTGIYNTLKRCVSRGLHKCNIFNHGMNAQFVFGQQTSVEAVKTPIQQCDDQIRKLFPGYVPFMFTPHQNSWNPYLLTALQELGYLGVSASSLPYSNMAWDVTKRPVQMPEQATTAGFDGNTNVDFVAQPINTTVANCENAIFAGQDCVIMMHPMEFANGQYNLTMLGELLDILFSKGYKDITFYDIIAENMQLTDAPTVAPTPNPTTTAKFNMLLSMNQAKSNQVSTQGAKAMEETVNHFLASPATNSFRGVVNGTQYGTSWKLFVQNQLTIPLSGPYTRFTGNETGLYHAIQGMIISSVRSGSFATYLRTRAQVNNATEFFNVTTLGVWLGQVNATSTETPSSSSDNTPWYLSPGGYALIAVTVVVLFIAANCLYNSYFTCKPCERKKHNNKLDGSSFIRFGRWLSYNPVHGKDTSTLELTDIVDSGILEVEDGEGSEADDDEYGANDRRVYNSKTGMIAYPTIDDGTFAYHADPVIADHV